MKRASYSAMQCSVAQTLEVVGDPWTLLIVRDALFGMTRFDDFHRSLGIPRTTLSTRLQSLVDHGVMLRRQYQDSPPRAEYALTEKGRALHTVIVAMLGWGDEWSDLPEPPITLVDGKSGEAIEPEFVDRTTGIPLRDLEIDRRFNSGAPSAD